MIHSYTDRQICTERHTQKTGKTQTDLLYLNIYQIPFSWPFFLFSETHRWFIICTGLLSPYLQMWCGVVFTWCRLLWDSAGPIQGEDRVLRERFLGGFLCFVAAVLTEQVQIRLDRSCSCCAHSARGSSHTRACRCAPSCFSGIDLHRSGDMITSVIPHSRSTLYAT